MEVGKKIANRQRELKEIYKEMKTPMGVFSIRNRINNRAFVDVNKDMKSIINRYRFQLEMGMNPIKELQQDWKEYGSEAFDFEVLEELKYDEKEETDYSEELEIMKMIWLEKLSKDGPIELYRK